MTIREYNHRLKWLRIGYPVALVLSFTLLMAASERGMAVWVGVNAVVSVVAFIGTIFVWLYFKLRDE